MKKSVLILMLVLLSLALMADQRGTTQKEYPVGTQVVGSAQPISRPISVTENASVEVDRNQWISVDSLKFARLIRPLEYMGFYFTPGTNSVTSFHNLPTLCAEAEQAIQKVPNWMKADLKNVLESLEPDFQIIWANLVNQAQDPYIDEIAFAVAHSSKVYLESEYANPQLFIDNANFIYSIDTDLNYVQIMNYGTSTTDPNYYSTTKYKRINTAGAMEEFEVPRDIYYWYIVHPKITDEIPGYVDPSLVESNVSHANNIVDPPVGKFWRQFLYEEGDAGEPVLSDALDSCQVVWDRRTATDDAIHAIMGWINQVMSFTSNAERPHQPLRIYKKHFGRCGEYADFTAAAARTALIPCTSILSASTDHTWNEFWENEWIQWEPVNNDYNHPLVYENGWGKVFGSVFEIRSDGYLTPVTERYSEGTASIIIHVSDSTQTAIDGARVVLGMDDAGTIRFDNLGYTDNAGNVEFIVGEARHYYVRVATLIGNNPEVPNTYLDLVQAVDGGEYAFQVEIAGDLQYADVSTATPPADETEDYRFMVNFNVPYQVKSGLVAWDDIDITGFSPVFFKYDYI